MNELKPCPFCKTKLLHSPFINPLSCGDYVVSCRGCGCEGPDVPSKELAIESWNTRAPDPRIADLEAENAALKEQLSGKWLPIESAPKDGTVILGTHTRFGNTAVYQTSWGICEPTTSGYIANKAEPWWRSHGEVRLAPTPTHWMPLPPAPEGPDA